MSRSLQIALAEAKYIGPINARYLLEECGSVEAIFESREALHRKLPRLANRVLDSLFSIELHRRATEIAQWCEAQRVRTLFVGEPNYPRRLSECPDAPILLYVIGRFETWERPYSLSVVGTRNITPYGQTSVDRLLDELRSFAPDLPIISGLAYGVDIAAHRKALALGMPTIAVLAHGLDRIYPAVHRQTATDIIDSGGALVSEYPPGTKPDRFNFVGRNRIIAGLSDACLVIEAGEKSGSLITAEIASSYDREVLALPGRIHDPYSRGCNELIGKMKGILVQSGTDILKAMGWEVSGNALQQELQFTPDIVSDDPIVQLIATSQPIHINDIIRHLGEDMRQVSARLFDLELDGIIRSLPGSLYALS